MRFDVSFLPALAAAFLLTFARVGTMIMLLPGIGEMTLPARVRLTMALLLTAILLPSHQKAYTVDLNTVGPVLIVLVQELMVGAVLGLTARLAISSLQVAGNAAEARGVAGVGLLRVEDALIGPADEGDLVGPGLHDLHARKLTPQAAFHGEGRAEQGHASDTARA